MWNTKIDHINRNYLVFNKLKTHGFDILKKDCRDWSDVIQIKCIFMVLILGAHSIV